MIKAKVLLLSNYPIVSGINGAIHGGQKRVAAIVDIYKKNFSEVKHCAIFLAQDYPNYGEEDIPLNVDESVRASSIFLASDTITGELIYESKRIREKITKIIADFMPDVIEVEQPFFLESIKRITSDMGISPRLVMNGQNHEAPMRKKILESFHQEKIIIKEVVDKIQEQETFAVGNCDLAIAVSASDEKEYIRMGAKKTCIAANGMYRVEATKQGIQKVTNKLELLGIKKYYLFIGSAHVPNTQGIKDYIGYQLGFIPADCAILLAGSVGSNLSQHIPEDTPEGAVFWSRVIALGSVEDDFLQALIENCEVMILPIGSGGGTNLKTAEALLNNKKIVATKFAMRGYEKFLKFPNLWVANNRDEFHKFMLAALASKYVRLSELQKKEVQTNEWSETLKISVEMIKELVV